MNKRKQVLEEYFSELLETESLTNEEVLAVLDGTFPKRRSILSRFFGGRALLMLGGLTLIVSVSAGLYSTFSSHRHDRTFSKGELHEVMLTEAFEQRSFDRETAWEGGEGRFSANAPDTNRSGIAGEPVSSDDSLGAGRESGPSPNVSSSVLRPSEILHGKPLVTLEPWVRPDTVKLSVRKIFDRRLDIIAKVRGIRLIELSPSELAQIGVQVTSDGIVRCYTVDTGTHEFRGGADVEKEPQVACRRLSPDSADVRSIADSDIPSGIVAGIERPWFALDFNRKFRTYRDQLFRSPMGRESDTVGSLRQGVVRESLDADHIDSPSFLNSCLLVRVPLPSAVGGGSVLLGFRNTLLRYLPERYRMPSDADLGEWDEPVVRIDSSQALRRGSAVVVPSQSEGQVSDPESEIRVPGSPYVDTWRTASGAILATELVRNPVGSVVTIRGTLSAPRNLTLSLYNVNGERVRTLVVAQAFRQGAFSIDGDVSGVPAGIYLLVVTTEQGEQGVQRVIVQ